MKKILSLTLALALMAAMFTGCGCAANVSTHPGGAITEDTTEPSIMPTPTATHATEPRETTRPHATMPTVTGSDPTDESSMPHGGTGSNGTTGGAGTEAGTTPTDSTMDARGRGRGRNSAR